MKNIKVVNATHVKDYIIDIEFSDGVKNKIDLQDELYGEVFKPLNDKNMFKNFKLNPITIYWENGADFSPEFLYELAKKNELQVSDKKSI